MVIRGSIEVAKDDLVAGWMYSDEALVRDRLILAFVDDVCVGSGRVELHRPDLETAGLGDGYLGFAFPITLAKSEDAGRVVVKLDGSDAMLLQRGSKVVWPGATSARTFDKEQADQLVASYKWMLSRGWLKQSDYDYLKNLTQFGVYERTLVAMTSGEPQIGDPKELASELLSLLHQRKVDIAVQEVQTPAAFADFLSDIRSGTERAAFGLWSSEPATMNVVEGSHMGGVDPLAENVGAVRFPLDPSHLVIVDANCYVDIAQSFPTKGLRVFTT